MNAIDTNILIYAIDRKEVVKRPIAGSLLLGLRSDHGTTVLPWQVAGEYLRYLSAEQRGGRLPPGSTRGFLEDIQIFFPIVLPSPQVLDVALDLADRYSLSHWDGMLLAACLVAGVDTLYTEDMGAPRKIDALILVNPFA